MKKAIVVTTFGVGDKNVKKKCIDTLIADIREAFPDYDVFEAWTSRFLIKKLAAQGTNYETLEEVLGDLEEAGYEKVVVAPTHLTPGQEFDNKVVKVVEEVKDKFTEVHVAEPALAGKGPEDYEGIADILFYLDSLEPGEELLLMGHGSPQRHNPVYEWVQQYADKKHLPVHIGVLEAEDHPNLDDVLERLKSKGVKKVFMRPMLLTGGDHATKDMAGDEPDSWKNVVSAAGIEVRFSTKGLGENNLYRSIYIKRIKNAL
ncbi:Sirohydrochlorin cobaltochelatase CbiK [Anaerovibrio sp. JC8]|uniref:sirohydrochlorin cobaltochelatase n=1 Tax=Anaerovibrio sp. JC8 TaxID=1240085 RepID=UPI000A0AA26A|nr:sirohydrochlorin cobaltochelatase [Anaerovibrio sp. JC8]ORT99553.1 Sirohydrochlorin cobaltochelatase CbiK [Anaerovibrio sp. JC8]